MDDSGVTEAAQKAGASIKNGAKMGYSKLNESIDSNPTLANAKQKTISGFTEAGSYMTKTFGGYFGWGKKP